VAAAASKEKLLHEIRAYASDQLACLPSALRELKAFSYPVEIGPELRRVADRLDRRDRKTASEPV